MSKIKSVAFDLDGTTGDTTSLFDKVLTGNAERNIKTDSLKWLHKIWQGIIRMYFTPYNLSITIFCPNKPPAPEFDERKNRNLI